MILFLVKLKFEGFGEYDLKDLEEILNAVKQKVNEKFKEVEFDAYINYHHSSEVIEDNYTGDVGEQVYTNGFFLIQLKLKNVTELLSILGTIISTIEVKGLKVKDIEFTALNI